MIVSGVDIDALADTEDSFNLPSNGRILLIDGDGPAYQAAATVKTVATGLRRWQSLILEQIFLAECEQGEVFLTHESSTKAGRKTVKGVQPYQGHRSKGSKPPLLSQVREAAEQDGAMDEFTVTMERVIEADDGMMIRSYALGEQGVIRSDDKDLRMTPWRYYNIKTGTIMPPDPFGDLWIEESDGGTKKLVGRSLKFFWAQMVMGDTADHIKGLLKLNGRDVGYSGAYALLGPLTNIGDVCNEVIDQYRKIDQNPLPEAWMLWMLRTPTDNVWRYFSELPFTQENRSYLDECVTRDWFTR